MDHNDHVYLLEGEPGLRERIGLPIHGSGGSWADLGSGWGAFTLALADLLSRPRYAGKAADPVPASITSIDRDRDALARQQAEMQRRFPRAAVTYRTADFTKPLDLPPLDGIVMANALHFVADREKLALLARLKGMLRPGGQFILVEYNVDRGNMWVPHPLSIGTWDRLARDAGYASIYRLGAKPSRFLGEIFSSVAVKEE